MRNGKSTTLATLIVMVAGCAATPPPGGGTRVVAPPSEAGSQVVETVAGERAALVAAHNRWRREVGAPDIVWSRALEQRAQRRAAALQGAGCRLAHEDDEFGENLYSTWTRPRKPQATPDEVVARWATARASYDYSTNRCRPGAQCGHYTQLVWADTRAVGCGSARCAAADGWHTLLWVCKYHPRGNYIGERPY